MSSGKSLLHIFIPGLFDNLQLWKQEYGFTPDAPVLTHLLNSARCEKSSGKGLDESLLELFGFPSGLELPIARYFYQQDFGEMPACPVLIASPVHLITGMTDVTMYPRIIDDLSDDECEAYLSLINEHFAENGLVFKKSQSGYWYVLLSGLSTPSKTFPVSQVLGKNILPFMQKSDELDWHTIENELQMLLYSSSQNINREARGQLVLSSFWFWGGGDWKPGVDYSLDAVSGGGMSGKMTAALGHCDWQPLLSLDDMRRGSGESVLILDNLLESMQLQDAENWQKQLTALEQEWIKPLAELLATGNAQMILHSCNNHGDKRRWVLNKSSFWAFLRRNKQGLLDILNS
jgi:hypothetical protein